MEGKILLLLAIVVVAVVFQRSDACMCLREHAQMVYCKSDFAIKVYVNKRQFGRVMSDGTFVPRKHHKKGKDKDDDEDDDDEDEEEQHGGKEKTHGAGGSEEEPILKDEAPEGDGEKAEVPAPVVHEGSPTAGATDAEVDTDNTDNTGNNTGDASINGNTGDASINGNAGDAGNTGNAGSTGNAGNTGNAGDAGNTGNAGDAGNTGNAGNAGSTGSTGSTGNAGDAGDAGNADSEVVSLPDNVQPSEGKSLGVQPIDTQEAEVILPPEDDGREITWARLTTGAGGPEGVLLNDQPEPEELVRPEVVRVAAAHRPNYISSYVGPDGAMPGHIAAFRGIRGKPLGLSSRDVPPSYPGRYQRSSGFPGDRAPGKRRRPHRLEKPRGVAYIRYNVGILKVFKGSVANGSNYIFTPPQSSICGLDLKRGSTLILMGRMRDGRMHINQCSFKLDTKALKPEEASNLGANMNHRFKRSCGECTVDVCFNEQHICDAQLAPTSTCIWRNLATVMQPRASLFACYARKSNPGVCGWHNERDEAMTPQDLDPHREEP